MSTIWVDKYKPKHSSDILGQSRNIARIKSWLKSFESNKSRPLFIYGPPGIGKTTAAHLCCKETGYQTLEFNASDQRNKNVIKDVISTIAGNSTLSFVKRASDTRDAIILDEIDGMAGNEDRGGIAQLIYEIRHTKKPMIFICNDGQHQKLRSLKDKCEVIEFKRPEYDAIRMVVTKIANKEGLQMDKINVKNLADSSDFDIRQIVNSLSLFKDGGSDQIVKTTRLNAFEACKKALSVTNQTIDDRFDCFFADYNIMPLFVYENYTKIKPSHGDHLKAVSRAADSICIGDLLEKQIRSNQNWSLLNAQALCSTVIPSKIVASNMLSRVDFPQFLGKLSNANKRMRLIQELNAHMCLSLRGGLDPDYLDVMSARLSAPLIKKDSLGGVEAVVDFMSDYSLLREDFNSIMELAAWSFKPDPMARVDTKTKTAFTNAYKKRAISLPYFIEDKSMASKKKKVNMFADVDEDVDDEDGDGDDDDDVAIKPKRVIKGAAKPAKAANEKKTESAKANGRGGAKESKAATKDEDKTKSTNGTGKSTAKTNSTNNNNKDNNDNSPPENAKGPSTNGNGQKADKRPPDGGIARFFIAKKPKQ